VERKAFPLYAEEEGIAPNLYYKWSKDFLEAGKRCLKGDTVPKPIIVSSIIPTFLTEI